MQGNDEGRPMTAMLLLFSMFAFAFAFHAVTRPDQQIAAAFNTQLAGLAVTVPSQRADILAVSAASAPASETSATLRRDLAASAFGFEGAPTPLVASAPAREPSGDRRQDLALAASAWSALPQPLPAAVTPSGLAQSAVEQGAVTRAFATTHSAVRNAFKRVF